MSDEYYIERKKATELLQHFEKALQDPTIHPLLFNIYGIGGVGKTTLLGRLKEAHADTADFLEVCFKKNDGIETPLKKPLELMRKLHRDLITLLGIESNNDLFTQREQQFEEILHELSRCSIDGENTSSEEASKIRVWFERSIWFGLTNSVSTLSKSILSDSFDFGYSAFSNVGNDTENWQEWIQQLVRNHPATKDQPELKALMLEPVSQLTQAFAESLIQTTQNRERAIILVLDTYEEAQSYLNHWLWRYLVEDNALASASVRIVVVGRKSLQTDEGWRKLNQDRKLLHETALIRFDRGETAEYLKKIGIKNGGILNNIYKVTQGLPYYLNWVREQHEKGKTLDFSRGNQAIAELLFQGLDPQRRKILQVVACCRWFDSALIRHLLKQEGLDLSVNTDEAEKYFGWIKSLDFVEFTKDHHRLDDVARDVFRKSYFYDDQNQFRKTNEILADYFYQKANECVDPQDLLPDCYEDEDWQRPMSESLYYGLFGKGKAGLRQYIDTFFVSVYLQQPDIFLTPFTFICAEINQDNEDLLSAKIDKFLEESQMVLNMGWLFLGKTSKNYQIKVEGENIPSEEELEILSKQIEASNQAIVQYAGDLKDGLGKCLGLTYKSIRCNNPREALDSILQAKSQAEELLENYRPKFVCSLFLNIGKMLSNFDKYQVAVECYEQARKLDCNNYLAFEGKASSLYFLEQYDEALENIKNAIALNPSPTEAWHDQGILLIHLRRYKESRESLKKAMDLSPQNYYIQNTHALNLSFLQDFEQAIIAIDQIINLEPNEVIYKANRGIILARAGRYDEALVDCEAAIKQNSKRESGYYAKACYYALKNDIDQVLENLRKAIDIDPNHSRREARWNPDFDAIRNDERFRTLIYPDS